METPSKDRTKDMQNASRRGAADMGMPLMIVAFIVIGAAVYGLAALVFGAIRPSDLKAMLRRKAT